jgi:DNA-binding MarR family transcriptional regulator
LYRHRTSLIGAESIGRLLGFANGSLGRALDELESLGFVERSRLSRGVRLYRFVLPSDAARRDAFQRLTNLADSRAGRLRLIEALQSLDQTPPEGEKAARDLGAKAGQSLSIAKEQSGLATKLPMPGGRKEQGGGGWLKVS